MSRNFRPDELCRVGTVWYVDDRGLKKRLKRFGVTVGGFFGFPCLRELYSAVDKLRGEEAGSNGEELLICSQHESEDAMNVLWHTIIGSAEPWSGTL